MAGHGSIAGPTAKLNRAKHHLAEIKEIVSSRSDIGGYETRREFSGDGRTCRLYVGDIVPIDPALPLIVGDCLFDLRAALDHLVYQLHVRRFRGHVPDDAAEDAMFPIRPKRPKGPEPLGGVDGVRRLSVRHRAAIERFQPYRTASDGYEDERLFLWMLNDLNRFDKHRHLNVVAVDSWAHAVSPFPRPPGLTFKSDPSAPLVSGALVAELSSDEDFRDSQVGHRVLSNIVFDDVEAKPEVVTLMHQMSGAVERVFAVVGRDLAQR